MAEFVRRDAAARQLPDRRAVGQGNRGCKGALPVAGARVAEATSLLGALVYFALVSYVHITL